MAEAILTWNQEAVTGVNQLASRIGENIAFLLRSMIRDSMGTSGFPKIRTGNLKGSITATKLDPLTFEVSTDVFYAPYVEFGTSKAAPYPYFRPNIERLKTAARGAII